MLSFDYQNHTHIVFGPETENRVGELVKGFNAKKVLVHFGSQSARKSGLLDRVENSLRASGIDFVELGGVVPNPRRSLARKGIQICKDEKVDFILAVGGGSVMDSSKTIGMGALYDGDVWDFYSGEPFHDVLPIGAVLTLPAAGSESSPDSVLTNDEHEVFLKRASCSDPKLRPVFAVMNPELTMTLPKWQTFCGMMDIIAHILERYFTTTRDVDMSDRMSEALIQSVMNAAEKLLENPNDYQARAQIMWCGNVAHNNILGVGRVQDWASHSIGHEISALYDATHGATLAMVFPAWMRYNYKHDIERFAQFANRVFGVPYTPDRLEGMALEGIRRFESFIHSVGLPLSFKEAGIENPDRRKMAEICTENGTRSIGGFVKLTTEDIFNIYSMI